MCAVGQVCSNAVCTTMCAQGQTLCGSDCVDTMGSVTNCGGCGVACDAGKSCVAGTCNCPQGELACGAACTNAQTDPNNCGACGRKCNLGGGCFGGKCNRLVVFVTILETIQGWRRTTDQEPSPERT